PPRPAPGDRESCRALWRGRCPISASGQAGAGVPGRHRAQLACLCGGVGCGEGRRGVQHGGACATHRAGDRPPMCPATAVSGVSEHGGTCTAVRWPGAADGRSGISVGEGKGGGRGPAATVSGVAEHGGTCTAVRWPGAADGSSGIKVGGGKGRCGRPIDTDGFMMKKPMLVAHGIVFLLGLILSTVLLVIGYNTELMFI